MTQASRMLAAVAAGVAILGLTSLTATADAQTTNAPSAAIAAHVQAAANVATAAGYRTGIGVLNLETGTYYGAGADTAAFASESVVKVFIATELLLTGQMTGDTETTAYEMITESDDDAADLLYGLVGGDTVIDLVAQHYGITDLGSPPTEEGWWGNTQITAKGLVYFYAAVAKDPVVGPWLTQAMAHASEYGLDGTYQFFGIAAATTGAAIKQGWGDDGTDSPDAVFNSTGYVDNATFAVAILTDGNPDSYGSAISDIVTSEAKALMPNGSIDDPTQHNPVISGLKIATGSDTVEVSATATDPDTSAPLSVQITNGSETVATGTTTSNGSFDISFAADDGQHSYTVTVANVGEGTANATATTPEVLVDSSAPTIATQVTQAAEPTQAAIRQHSADTADMRLVIPALGASLLPVGFGVTRYRRRHRHTCRTRRH